MTTTASTDTTTRTSLVFRVYIKASAQAVWDAITQPEWNARYGYPGHSDYELRPGGAFVVPATDEMKGFGMPDVVVDGEILESDPPHRLVQTWRFNFAPDQTEEGYRTVTFEIVPDGEITRLTVTHDVTDAPIAASMLGGDAPLQEGGGGWAWILSGLKTLLETGEAIQG